MNRSNFNFVAAVWPSLLNDCRQIERNARTNPRGSAFQARFVLEQIVRHIATLKRIPTDSTTFEIMRNPQFERILPSRIIDKMHIIRLRGNDAAHSKANFNPQTSQIVVQHLWDVMIYAATHFSGKQLPPIPAFNPEHLKQTGSSAQTRQQIQALERERNRVAKQNKEYELLLTEAEQQALKERENHARALAAKNEENQRLEAELAALREQQRAHIEQQAQQFEPQPLPAPARNEADTRKDIIDPMLAEAGFHEGKNLTSEYPVGGLRVDYMLWDDDGTPLAVLEAKKTSRSIEDGRDQAATYADHIHRATGHMPIIMYTNGYDIRLWDRDANLRGGHGYPERVIEAYPRPEQLANMIRRRHTRKQLGEIVPSNVAGRPYQKQMICNLAERFDQGYRRGLLVMATGTGKTRVSISAVKMMMEAGWVRNVLFLADRTILVSQAHADFAQHLPEANPVHLLRNSDGEGQVYVCTYQTMIDRIGDYDRFNAFDFDLTSSSTKPTEASISATAGSSNISTPTS